MCSIQILQNQQKIDFTMGICKTQKVDIEAKQQKEHLKPQFTFCCSADLNDRFYRYKEIVQYLKKTGIFAKDSEQLQNNIKAYRNEEKQLESSTVCLAAIGDVVMLHTSISGDISRQWIAQACMRHHKFVEQFPIQSLDYEQCLKQYKAFLQHTYKHIDKPMEPSNSAHFMWHAHMLDPKAYKNDVKTMFGFMLDHEDKPVEKINIGKKREPSSKILGDGQTAAVPRKTYQSIPSQIQNNIKREPTEANKVEQEAKTIAKAEDIASKDVIQVKPVLEEIKNPLIAQKIQRLGPEHFKVDVNPSTFNDLKGVVRYLQESKIFSQHSVKLQENLNLYNKKVQTSDFRSKDLLKAIDTVNRVYQVQPSYLKEACYRYHLAIESIPLDKVNYDDCMRQYQKVLESAYENPDYIQQKNQLAEFMRYVHLMEPEKFNQDIDRMFGKKHQEKSKLHMRKINNSGQTLSREEIIKLPEDDQNEAAKQEKVKLSFIDSEPGSPARQKNDSVHSAKNRSDFKYWSTKIDADIIDLFSVAPNIQKYIKEQKLFRENTSQLRQRIKSFIERYKDYGLPSFYWMDTEPDFVPLIYIGYLHPTKPILEQSEEWILQACLKHQKFADSLEGQKADFYKCMQEYDRFLQHATQNIDKPLKPSKLADLMWHAHMQDPQAYQRDMKEIFGFVLEHEDEEIETAHLKKIAAENQKKNKLQEEQKIQRQHYDPTPRKYKVNIDFETFIKYKRTMEYIKESKIFEKQSKMLQEHIMSYFDGQRADNKFNQSLSTQYLRAIEAIHNTNKMATMSELSDMCLAHHKKMEQLDLKTVHYNNCMDKYQKVLQKVIKSDVFDSSSLPKLGQFMNHVHMQNPEQFEQDIERLTKSNISTQKKEVPQLDNDLEAPQEISPESIQVNIDIEIFNDYKETVRFIQQSKIFAQPSDKLFDYVVLYLQKKPTPSQEQTKAVKAIEAIVKANEGCPDVKIAQLCLEAYNMLSQIDLNTLNYEDCLAEYKEMLVRTYKDPNGSFEASKAAEFMHQAHKQKPKIYKKEFAKIFGTKMEQVTGKQESAFTLLDL